MQKAIAENEEYTPDERYYRLSNAENPSSRNSSLTIKGGYTINFYNHNKELIESHSAKCGNYIDKPISYLTGSWQNENGYANAFPLTAEEEGTVINLYASDEIDCATQLYNYFGLSKEDYPHLMITISNDSQYGGAQVYFGHASYFAIDDSTSRNIIMFMNPLKIGKTAYANSFAWGDDMSKNIQIFISSCGELSDSSNGNMATSPDSAIISYTNFEIEVTDGRLDETLYIG